MAYKKPFSKSYVLRVTAEHILESLDISINKTFERIAEFDSNAAKSKEIFMTLSELHQLRKQLSDFHELHKEKDTK